LPRAKGVVVAEWRALATWSGRDGESAGPLADACLMRQPAKAPDRVAREGLVTRSNDAGDARMACVRLADLEAVRAQAAMVMTRMAPSKALLRGLLTRHGE